jgi:hypothetical protein
MGMDQINYHIFSPVTLVALFCWSLLDLSLYEALTVPAAFTRIRRADARCKQQHHTQTGEIMP